MAAPIVTIKKHILSEEEQKKQKMNELQTLLTEHEDALQTIFNIVGELNEAGLLEAAEMMIKSKEDIGKIVLHQATREPVTNLINHLMVGAGALTVLDPQVTSKLVASAGKGLESATDYLDGGKKISVFDVMKTLNDPDINRALGFGIHFLKGMGKGLAEEDKQH